MEIFHRLRNHTVAKGQADDKNEQLHLLPQSDSQPEDHLGLLHA